MMDELHPPAKARRLSGQSSHAGTAEGGHDGVGWADGFRGGRVRRVDEVRKLPVPSWFLG